MRNLIEITKLQRETRKYKISNKVMRWTRNKNSNNLLKSTHCKKVSEKQKATVHKKYN